MMKLNLVGVNEPIAVSSKVVFTKAINAALSGYTNNIRKINVRIEKQVDKQVGRLTLCQVELLLPGLPTLKVKTKGKTLLQALNRALSNCKQILKQNYFKLS
ncbi:MULTISPECIES: hypothetical protein [Pseudoalteromonas]|uniref:hypothetical protein n=1 Tax=Pseudoalteromonas TaxID=53246 RepID=UPI001D0A3414|nr:MULTISPECIES: hypothetical protein [Pseudoalteromonas]MCF2828523.1 hypothetical protein [Pseudoalteromonas sp. OF5H-5]MCF2832963.1 hypothetical protein [Pseudoalteromonas sp. DL2-H6]MCF2924873.1 hypothetical protein [Pseudoalteromonas sp. DL2-H1]MCF7515668.1 hypothetical protein [Pseudoalteromonas sp. L7]MCF7527675.1 hypothetical protein [Pseudoalteromonas sp. L23]